MMERAMFERTARTLWERGRGRWEIRRLAATLHTEDPWLAELLTDVDEERRQVRRTASAYLWWMLLWFAAVFLVGGVVLDVPAADFLGLVCAATCYLLRDRRRRAPRDLAPELDRRTDPRV